MVKVLVANDDGIDAKGIRALTEALAPLADVYVVAPANEQSAKAQSITFLHPIKTEKREVKGAVEAYAVEGTPTDCVMWGLGMLKKEGIVPDFVISGINLGYNTGLAAYYSGTVAAAREGALNGIKSIALSSGSHEASEFDYILGMLPMLMEMAGRISPGVILNVNVPDLPADEIKGYKILETAPFGYGVNFLFSEVGENEYKMGGEPAELGDSIRYDFDANEAGYAAISPIPTSMTDRVSLSRLRNAFASDSILTVIVDAQRDILEELPDPYSLESKLSALSYCADRLDMPVLMTQRYGKGGIIKGVHEHASRSEVVERMQTDPWFAEDMEKHTKLIDAKKVIIAGAETHVSVLHTAQGFKDRGFDVCVLEDCCDSFDPSQHRAAMRKLKEIGCSISILETEIAKIADERDEYIRSSIDRILKRSRQI